jgi:hypothetical protein
MCKDNDHGGARCPSDTSEARRLRRKASNLRNSIGERQETPDSETITIDTAKIEEFKAKAEALKEEIYNAPTGPKAQLKHDAKMEKKITAFGMALGQEAEKLAGFKSEDMETQQNLIAENLYAEINTLMEANNLRRSEVEDRWEEFDVNERFNLNRWSSPDELAEEEISQLSDEEKAVYDEYAVTKANHDEYMDKYREIDKEYDAARAKLYEESNKKLTEAYQTVIAAIRPVGGEVKGEVKESSEGVREIMDNTVAKHYPTEWLQHHNDNNGEDMVLQYTDSRPMFVAGQFSETEDDGIEKSAEAGGTLTVPNGYEEDFQKAYGNQILTNLDYRQWTGTTVKAIAVKFPEEEIYDADKHGPDAPSEATGWEYRATLMAGSMPNVQFNDNDSYAKHMLEKRWVKRVTKTKKLVSSLSIFSKESSEQILKEQMKNRYDLTAGTAYHEFGHRMEQVLPNNILPRQERAFLMRRANKTIGDDNEYSNMVPTGMGGEYGHDGKFVSKYVGRDYFTGENYEVFTMGIESLYSGANGGLVKNGLEVYTEDKDHRGFVLGALATL